MVSRFLLTMWRRQYRKGELYAATPPTFVPLKAHRPATSVAVKKGAWPPDRANQWLLGDRGHDADWLRKALQDKGIRACIPGRKQRKTPVKYDKRPIGAACLKKAG
ncbi:hypothetical protein A3764_17315 [Sulfitobacter sp. HI0129]|jgi:hypothetical protein|nr:hypothetical protein A3764_17315 [Sulfitobacter sp. HI0129]